MIYLRRVRGDSMLPELKPGELVLLVKGFRYKPGQVVMLRHKGKEKIKRLSEINRTHVYVTGINPDTSTDSRHFGWVPARLVKARLLYKFKK